jgi:CBS domain-containing protein
VLVLDGARIVGIVSATDVTRAIELAELRPRVDPTVRHAADHDLR